MKKKGGNTHKLMAGCQVFTVEIQQFRGDLKKNFFFETENEKRQSEYWMKCVRCVLACCVHCVWRELVTVRVCVSV